MSTSGGIPFLADREMTALAREVPAFRRMHFAAGTTVFRQSDRADGMYVIESGRLRIWVRLPGDEVIELQVCGAGCVVGELALMDGGLRSASVDAVEDTVAGFLERRAFDALRADGSSVALRLRGRLARDLCSDLRRLMGQLGSLGLRDSDDGRCHTHSRPSLHPEVPLPPSTDASNFDRELLVGLPFLEDFTADDIEALLSAARRVQAPRGSVLSEHGTAQRACYLVVRGAVQASLQRGGRPERLALLGPGRVPALAAYVERASNQESFQVREDALLLELRFDALDALFASHPKMASRLVDAMLRELTESIRHANRRLAREVVDVRASRRPPPIA